MAGPPCVSGGQCSPARSPPPRGGSRPGPSRSRSTSRTACPRSRSSACPTPPCARAASGSASALRNCGFDLPPRAVTVNLAPADLRKEGNHLDLAIALALLAAHGAPARRRRSPAGCSAASSGSTAPCGRCAAGSRSPTSAAGSAAGSSCCPPPTPARRRRPARCRSSALGGLLEALGHLLGERAARAGPSGAAASGAATRTGRRPRRGARPGGGQARARGRRGRAATTCSSSARPAPARRCSPARCPRLLPPLTPVEAIAVTKIHSLVADEPPAGLLLGTPLPRPPTPASRPPGWSAADRCRVRARSAWRTPACSSSTSSPSSAATPSKRCGSRSRTAW